MSRPPLSEQSFLAHVFGPKKNPLPTGLRKRTFVGAKGRKVSRLNAFNKMSALKQEVLNRAGLREDYLRGDLTYTDVKRRLRTQAVARGVVKPLRTRTRPRSGGNVVVDRRARLEAMIAMHLGNTVAAAGRYPNWRTIEEQNEYLDQPREEMTRWDYGQFKYAGRRGSEYERVDNGRTHNPFWYH